MYSEETSYSRMSRPGAMSSRDLPPEDFSGRGCSCGGGGEAEMLPEDLSGVKLGDLPIAMAYVPPQVWRDIFEPDTALREGTQFRELALPFTGSRPTGERGGRCRG